MKVNFSGSKTFSILFYHSFTATTTIIPISHATATTSVTMFRMNSTST